MFENEVIDRYMYMHCNMQNFIFKNAQVSIYSLADLNIGHCVELTFPENKLGRFLMLTFLKWSFQTYCILKVKVKVDSTQMRIVFSL